MKEIKQIFKEINKAKKIIIARHMGPDPDALTSQIALRDSIRETFLDKEVYAVGAGAVCLNYIGQLDKLPEDDPDALLILLDVPDIKRIDGVDLSLYQNTIKIDHHPPIDLKCQLEWVDEDACSTAQMIAELILKTKLIINQAIAEKLFIGIVVDSQRFLYTNSPAPVFRQVADLIEAVDLDITPLYYQIYNRPMRELKFQGYIASNFKITKNGLAHLYLTDEIIKEYQVDTAIAGNMINNFSHVQDVYVWVIFTEDKVNDNIRGSMRSRQVIINDIAEEFGGGGHHYACGVKLQTKSQMESLIKKLDQRLKKERDDVNEAS